jgi:DNA-binding response OmpR family regulator
LPHSHRRKTRSMQIIHVLLVDDDPDILALLSGHLTAAGIGVEAVDSGQKALARLQEFQPELIISDVQMPGMSGYELCRKVRASGHDDIPFFFCSALSSVPERITGLRMGADDYLVKPVNPEELLLKVTMQLEKNRRMRKLRELAEARQNSVIEGNLKELEVFQVLQLVDQRGRGEVRVTFQYDPDKKAAELYVNSREILHCEVGEVVGEKAFMRLLGLEEGTFLVQPYVYIGHRTMEGRVDEWLLNSLTQLDEYRLLMDELHKRGDFLFVRYSEGLFKRRFDDSTLHVISMVEEHHRLERVLDRSQLTDLETARIVLELLSLSILGANATPDAIAGA